MGSGSNRILIVGVSLADGNVTVNSVTYGGTALTLIGGQTQPQNKVRVEMWKLVAPASGTANIVVTLSAAKRIVGGAVSFTGVNQITPLGPFASNTGSSILPTDNVTVDVVSGTSELIIDTFATQGDANPAIASVGQTQRWNETTGAGSVTEILGGGSTKPGTPILTTMSWLISKKRPWAIGAVSLKPVPSVVLNKSVSPTGGQLPGTDLNYTIAFTNAGSAPATNLVVQDQIPTFTDFKVSSVTTNPGTTGLTVAVSYSNNNGSTWTYTPASGGGGAPAGYDRNVTNIRWTFTGILVEIAPNNAGSVAFTSRIQ